MYELGSTGLKVFERDDWHARAPRAMASQRNPTEVFIHHTADTRAEGVDHLDEQAAAMRAIQGFHMDVRGYSDVGYAYVVFQPYGELERARVFEGRLVRWVPAAQLGHNTGTIPVSVFGNFQRDDGVKDATLDAIVALLTKSASKTGCGSAKTIGGHRDVVATSCPGDTLYAKVGELATRTGLRRFRPSSSLRRPW